MSTEEKAKAYDEALKRAKEWITEREQLICPREIVESIFPQLRESENDVEKELLNTIHKAWYADLITLDMLEKMVTYLEKQKEHHIPWYDYKKSKEAGYTIVPNEEYEQLIKQEENKDELVYRLNGLMQDYIKEGKDDEEKEHRLKCYQLFWNALEDTSFFEQEEQKPVVSLDTMLSKDPHLPKQAVNMFGL